MEDEVINAELDQESIVNFSKHIKEGWIQNGVIRQLLEEHSSVKMKLGYFPKVSKQIPKTGYNQRHSKKYFIRQDKTGYPEDYGQRFGKELGSAVNLKFFEKINSLAPAIEIDGENRSIDKVLSDMFEIFDERDDTVLFIPFALRSISYSEPKRFVSRNLVNKDYKYSQYQHFAGVFKKGVREIPVFYKPGKEDFVAIAVNMASVAQLVIYKPNKDSSDKEELFVSVSLLTDNEMKEIIKAKPNSLQNLSREEKERKLKQEVGLRIHERFRFWKIDSNHTQSFKILNLRGY